ERLVDIRPDFVKRILRGGHNVTAFEEDGRWYFEETLSPDRRPVGHRVIFYRGDEVIPARWDGTRWIDERVPGDVPLEMTAGRARHRA
uniref:hypothetical protein n=1 Tax=Pseudomonas canadensis TaxID=915099 RepID=UPI0030D6F10F